MLLKRKWRAAIALSAVAGGIMLLAGCQKATDDVIAPADEAVGDTRSFGGTFMYALITAPGGSALTRVNPVLRTYAAVPRLIVDSALNNVDHFMGIAWDASRNCTWLVTNSGATNPRHRNRLWRIPGPLPTTGGGGTIVAVRGPLLTDAITGLTVTNAMDIERDPVTGNIYLLRQGGQFAILTNTGLVTNLSSVASNVQAFTFSCNGRMMVMKTATSPVEIHEVDKVTGSDIGTSIYPSPLMPFSPDGGMEPAPGGCDLFAVNAFAFPIGMISTSAPFFSTHASLASTLDMTSM
jgi:hypothetical protein